MEKEPQPEQITVKPKFSKLAIYTLITPVIIWIAISFPSIIINVAANRRMTVNLAFIQFLLHNPVVMIIQFIITCILAIKAYLQINKSNQHLKGKRFIVEGVILSLFFLVFMFWYWRIYITSGAVICFFPMPT